MMRVDEFVALCKQADADRDNPASFEAINQRMAVINAEFVVIDGKLHLRALDERGVAPAQEAKV